MSFDPVPFNIFGSTGGGKSTQFSSEIARNIYYAYSESADRVGAFDFPGLTLFADGSSLGVNRGGYVFGGVLYKINGTTLYSVSSGGVFTTVGTVGAGTDRATWCDDGEHLLFVVSGTVYKYDGATLSTVTVQAVISNPSSITYIDGRFIVTGDDGLFGNSEARDPDTWSALDYNEEGSKSDPLVRAYLFNQLIYMMGSSSIVPWYYSGSGNPPFDRQNTALVNVGLAGVDAVTNSKAEMFWLGDDRKFYHAVGASFEPISSPYIAKIVKDFETVSDCALSFFTTEGQDFLLAAFPTENKTYLYSVTLKYWVVLASGTSDPGDAWYGVSVINCYGKELVFDYRHGSIYELDSDAYTDDGDARLRVRVFPVFTGKMLRAPGKRIIVGRITFNMQRGVGLESGQGSDPVIMCQMSNDGGHTWGDETFVSIGQIGEYISLVDYYDFSTGYEIRVKVKCSDPVYFAMFDGIAYAKVAGY